jgi:hypothetical protein
MVHTWTDDAPNWCEDCVCCAAGLWHNACLLGLWQLARFLQHKTRVHWLVVKF